MKKYEQELKEMSNENLLIELTTQICNYFEEKPDKIKGVESELLSRLKQPLTVKKIKWQDIGGGTHIGKCGDADIGDVNYNELTGMYDVISISMGPTIEEATVFNAKQVIEDIFNKFIQEVTARDFKTKGEK